MLDSLHIDAPRIQIPATFTGIPCSGVLVPSFSSPSVFGSAWQGSDGSIGVVLTNISGKQVTATVNLDNLPPGYSSYHSLNVTVIPLEARFTMLKVALNISVNPSAGGFTNPLASGSPYLENVGAIVSVSESSNPGYSFYYWSLDGTNVGNNPTYSVLMSSAHTLTVFFRGTLSISLSLSAVSLTLGAAVTLSGTITPTQLSPGIPAGTTVSLRYSIDGGSTWTTFITTQTSPWGSYSVIWYLPYPNNFQLQASWGGDQNYEGSTSPIAFLSVTGVVPSRITLLVAGPSAVARGSSASFDVLVTNPGSGTIATLYIEIMGAGGYHYFDTLQIFITGSSTARSQFTWQVPLGLQAGSYRVTVGLIPPTPTSISQTQITVT
jgi:hypothetical protein